MNAHRAASHGTSGRHGTSPRALTLDYWNTIYLGTSRPERVARRKVALAELLDRIGVLVPNEEFERLYRASAIEADRWWREEHRGYSSADRIRWMLAQLGADRPSGDADIAWAVQQVDDTLVEYPSPLLLGAREAIAALAERYPLAIVSDTGFAGGRAQDRLLERDGMRRYFVATIYSMDIGHAKPRPEIFEAALSVLGVVAGETLHVGDSERTDVGGALAMGMRAVRLDVVQPNGPTAGEFVATTLDEMVAYLLNVA